MNYSSSFRRGVRMFFPTSFTSITHDISDYDESGIFCYLKNVNNLYPTTIPTAYGGSNIVFPLAMQSYEPLRADKPENILNVLGAKVRRVIIGENTYYASYGCVFDGDKNPIIITASTNSASCEPVICMDYSVIENADDPMAKFIMKKLIPYFVFVRPHEEYKYMFMNCDSFIVKPTFQGELDHKLVSEYLCSRLCKEYK